MGKWAEVIKGMEELLERIKAGEAIEVTEVAREETPDGPLHTREKKMVVLCPKETTDEQRDQS